MFDIGFSELVVVGVVALLVIGPERLPKVARTAGHMLGRFQRYAAGVKADISREMQVEDLRKAGQDFKQSLQSAVSGVETQANLVDDYLKNEIAGIQQEIVMPVDADPAPGTSAGTTSAADANPQQSLDLSIAPAAVIEYAAPPRAAKPTQT